MSVDEMSVIKMVIPNIGDVDNVVLDITGSSLQGLKGSTPAHDLKVNLINSQRTAPVVPLLAFCLDPALTTFQRYYQKA